MKIYVGFSEPKAFSPFAALINAVECRGYDHVYIRIQEPCNNAWMIFQASGLVVNTLSVPMFLSSKNALKEYEIDCSDEQYKAAWAFINANLGLPYSLLEDFGILLMKVFKLKKQPFNKGMSAWFCSALGAQVCEVLGIEIPKEIQSIDPSGLDTILSNKGLPCVLNPVLPAA